MLDAPSGRRVPVDHRRSRGRVMTARVIVTWADGLTTVRPALDLADAERIADMIRRTYGMDGVDGGGIDEIRVESRGPAANGFLCVLREDAVKVDVGPIAATDYPSEPDGPWGATDA